MKPSNRRERTIALLKFLLLFFITAAIIVLAVYYDFKVPVAENKALKLRSEQSRLELSFQSGFADRIAEVKTSLDSINSAGSNYFYLDQLVSNKLAAMKESIPVKDSLTQRKMYDYIIHNMLSLQEAIRNLRTLKDAEIAMKALRDNIDKYKAELEQTRRELLIYKQLAAMPR
jgi:hypothetical protein